ncbi:glycosyltransferase family 4 protein [Plebeiibacterium marinum]|uniref:Glycosyltransferase n=1 Tax=Plebeiibacterium marinum TaxID=2992111 RepID=A0AAE3MHA9_9BACT|nr:glycosyltransferase [Plebeiobacterium marinum]MCW3807481.1 glycosyltransferase [Plebeiobacterium marinum]
MQEKKKILIFIDWFLPGYKAGGPVRSMANMVEYLKDEYEFFIVTRNTDYTETTPYDGITPNVWTDFAEGVKVFYASIEFQNFKSFKQIIGRREKGEGRREAGPFDVVYINGIYSWKYSIMPLIALKKFKGKKIVASRGMLAQSAIDVKGGKKKLFLKLVKMLNLYKGIVFHATNEKEKEDILRSIGSDSNVVIADNLPKKELPHFKAINKEAGELKLVSLARISPEKNTLFAIERLSELKEVKGEIVFDLYGQVYNQEYWEECKKVIANLPNNIKVTHKGLVDADKVGEMIQQYHVLFLPSRGENFGHVILESFMSGRPVLISDQTPWRGLIDEKCGWDIQLNERREMKELSDWSTALSDLLEMEQDEFDKWCEGARAKADGFICNPELEKSYKELLY